MLTVGMYVADRYEIVGKIGAGGMSDVFKAMDHILGRFVAIKVLKQEFSEDVNFVTKFRTEAQSAAGLEHPNIVNIYDVGSENGIYYIVMEYVEGITLKTYIEKKGQLSYKETVSIAIQIGRGIEAAHNKHIVHRDIKPQNVIISTEGKVKVTDFGIARAANSNTIHSDVMGSVHYTSPEQARNGYVDGKSDIYSLGIVMYEMVTGRVPFDGDTTVAVAIQHLQEEMTPPSAFARELPVSMEKIILKCTQKNPDRRYETISDLLVDLKKVLISPEEDFVTLIPVNQNKTRVIAEGEVETIRNEARYINYEDPEQDDDEEDEEDEDDGGFLNPRMEKAVTIMGIVAAVIIVIIIIYIVGSMTGLFRFGGGKEEDQIEEDQGGDEDTVEMISLLGMTEDEARKALKDMDLGIQIVGTESSDKYEEGQIMSQSVEEGEEVPIHTTIEVIICSGPGEFETPDVKGKTEAEADRMIREAGLEPKRDYAYDSTVPAGQVISQSPAAGTMVKEGDTVTYIVSQGTETVVVPDVKNRSEADARAILAGAGFNSISVTSEYNDTVAAGYVIRQSPVNVSVEKDATINLVVSLGRQTAYYSYKSNDISKPTTNAAYDVELIGSESDERIPIKEIKDNGSSITVIAENIPNFPSGTLYIHWRWTTEDTRDEEGNVVKPGESMERTDTLNVSFQRQ